MDQGSIRPTPNRYVGLVVVNPACPGTLVHEVRVAREALDIIKACLDNEPPYGGSILEHVKASGGEEYIKESIARILNALPGRDDREVIEITQRGADTDVYWRKTDETLLRYPGNGKARIRADLSRPSIAAPFASGSSQLKLANTEGVQCCSREGSPFQIF
jgi:hypothetical protein